MTSLYLEAGDMEFDKSYNYSKILLHNFEELRCNEEFFDFELKSGNTVVKAHRLVLAAASPYFAAMLRSGLEEARSGSVSLPAVAPDVLTALVDFIYTGKIHITDKVQQLMIAADMLQLEDLVTACADHLETQLTPSNVLGLLRFAAELRRPALAERARRYALLHWSAVAERQELLDLPLSLLTELMSSDAMTVKCESEVLRAGLRWLDHEHEARASHRLAVLRHVRLRLVPPDRLRQELKNIGDSHVIEVLDVIREAPESALPRRGSLKLRRGSTDPQWRHVTGAHGAATEEHRPAVERHR